MAEREVPQAAPAARPSQAAAGSRGEELRQRIMECWQQRLKEVDKEGAPPQDAEKSALVWALGKLPVSLFPRVPKVVEVPSSMSLREAISALEQHNFRCLPVRNALKGTSKEWNERYLGVVDYPGIVLWVFAALGAGPEDVAAETEFPSRALLGLAASTAAALYADSGMAPEPKEQQAKQVPVKEAGAAEEESPLEGVVPEGAWYATAGLEGFRARFREEILKNSIFQDNQVGDVIGSFRFTPFVPVDPGESVLSVLLLMSQERVKLAPIIAPQSDEIENVVTPMGVLDFLCLCRGLPWFDCIAEQPISALGLPAGAKDSIVKVTQSDVLMEPFRLMLEKEISGVPVVAPLEGCPGEESVVANISASDILRLLHCPRLFEGQINPSSLTVSHFIEAVQADLALGGAREAVGPTMKPPISCKREAKLISIMSVMRRSRIRRFYVTEENAALVGIITLRDIIAVFTSSQVGQPSRVEGYGA